MTFISGLVLSLSRQNMAGHSRRAAFFGRFTGANLAGLIVTEPNRVVIVIATWTVMGWLITDLIGSQTLTEGLDLDGRVFFYTDVHATDPGGGIMLAIMTVSLRVARMINAQSDCSTVDNAASGTASKVTHNPVGTVGAFQGNGGDLVTGRPRASMGGDDDRLLHRPIRLRAVIRAPCDRITPILRRKERLRKVIHNDSLSLTALNPTSNDAIIRYRGDLE